jgi:cytochrome c
MARATLAVLVVLATGVAIFALGLDATEDDPPAVARTGSSAAAGRGENAIAVYGCGGCHTIPGVVGADATVGPPLTDWHDRAYIAGRLANTPQNLTRWIANPQAVEPGTAMPNLSVPLPTARKIAQYLFRGR